jgi:hypothetical protein
MPDVLLTNQTDITILAKVDGTSLQFFLVDSLTVLTDQKIQDTFGAKTDDKTVTVAVVSTDGAVTVKNRDGADWNSTSAPSGNVIFYWAYTTLSVPAAGTDPTSTEEGFTIKVGNSSVDPTVIISRTGAGNLAVRTASRHG